MMVTALMPIFQPKKNWFLHDKFIMSEKKPWSLQNDNRTEAERNIFKPTGKSPKNNTTVYLISLVGVFLLVSFLMTYFSEKTLNACIGSYCFNSNEDLVVYSLYVFLNIIIVVLAIFVAYMFGRKLADQIKK